VAGLSSDDNHVETTTLTQMYGWEAKDRLDKSLLLGYFEKNPTDKLMSNKQDEKKNLRLI
jgi:hypothetical protein